MSLRPSFSEGNTIKVLSCQVNSSTLLSKFAVRLRGLLLNAPLGSTSTTVSSQRSASKPARFWARYASFLPSGENFGAPSAAWLSFVRHSHFFLPPVIGTRQRS